MGLSGCTEPGGAASARRSDFCCGNGSWSGGTFPGCSGPAQAELKRAVGGSLDLALFSSLQNLKWKNRNQAFPSLVLLAPPLGTSVSSSRRRGLWSALSNRDPESCLSSLLFAGLRSQRGPGWNPSSLPITSGVTPGGSLALSEPRFCPSMTWVVE